MLELDEGQLSRPVLRGGGGGNVTSLPDNPRPVNGYVLVAAPPLADDRQLAIEVGQVEVPEGHRADHLDVVVEVEPLNPRLGVGETALEGRLRRLEEMNQRILQRYEAMEKERAVRYNKLSQDFKTLQERLKFESAPNVGTGGMTGCLMVRSPGSG
jgi:hypothetical protein